MCVSVALSLSLSLYVCVCACVLCCVRDESIENAKSPLVGVCVWMGVCECESNVCVGENA